MKKDSCKLTPSKIHALSDRELDKAIESMESQVGAALGQPFGDKGKDHTISMTDNVGGQLMMLAASFHSEKNRRATS